MDSDDVQDVADTYDEIAESYAAGYWDENPFQAHFEFPATTALIPDVAGRRILDAGCGSGVYTNWLVERGGEVVAADVSEEMLAETAERVDDGVELERTDLTTPLEFADDDEFDGVVSGSVIDHVEDWDRLFAEFARVLAPGGFLVCSMRHPMGNYVEYDDWNYFEADSYTADWGVEMITHRRPMSAVVNPLLDAGFRLDELSEPEPTEAFAEQCPEEYETFSEPPYWLCLRAVRS